MSDLSRRSFLAASGAAAAMSAGVFAAEGDSADNSRIGKTPHTKFAVNIEMWWTKLPFLDRIRQTAALGFPAVEFWPWDNKDLDATLKLTQELKIEIAQFTAWGFKPGLNDSKNHKAFVKAIQDGCRVAKQLKCRKMTVVAGDDQPGMTQEEMHENVITGLKLAAPIAEDHDVMMILEPMNIRVDHKGHCLYGSAPAIRICDEVKSSHVKINWDLYHMQITEGDLCGHLAEGMKAGQIGYLQLADHPGRHEPGTGEVHYNRVLKQAHDLGYRDYIGLECRPKEGELAAAKRVAMADRW
ncbi:MAG: TIM barrel protein [Planctomycetota bacterium]|nr:TIM barrel protein [Planctomycetota bacterium]